MRTGIERVEAEAFGDVLLKAEGAIIVGAILDPETRDPGNTPPTYLRAGLVLSKTTNGTWREFGATLAQATNVSAQGQGSSPYTTFLLPHGHILPFSETLRVGATVLGKDDYSIDYFSGIVILRTPATSLTASYLYVPKVSGVPAFDGTHVPLGILLNPVSMLNEEGLPVAKSAQVLIAGMVKPEKLIVAKEGSLAYAKYALARVGIIIPEPVTDY